MKVIQVLLDGLGDRSYAVLGNRTPLEAAHTPNMDRLAALGANGLYHASFPGECLPSETAHYLMFGYDRQNFPGRGLLEAVGDEVGFDDADVLALAHLCGAVERDGRFTLSFGRDDIKGSAEEIGRVFDALSPYEAGGVSFRLRQTRRNDAILVMKGDVSPDISDSDPIILGKPIGKVLPLASSEEPVRAARTAVALNRYLSHCHKEMTGGKAAPFCTGLSAGANFLVTQRCGRRIPQVPFRETWGFCAAIIASVSLYGGLARELGIDFLRVQDSDDPGGDLGERVLRALEDSRHDFIHVHTKVPDEVAHKCDPATKKEAIEALDSGIGDLAAAVSGDTDLLVVLTADHSTPSDSVMIHSGEAVPLVMAGRGVRRDRVARFDEIHAAAGSLGMLRGRELMYMILNAADRGVLLGHRLGRIVRPYDPEEYPPFELC